MWRILGVYVNSDMERKREDLKDWMDEKDKGIKTIIGGDFNARMATKGKWEDLEKREGG